VYVCLYAQTHTHGTWGHDGVRSEPTGQDETLEGPEESRWTNSRQICIRICVQSTHLYIYAVRRDEIWTNCPFPFTYFPFRESKAKDVIVKHRYLKSNKDSRK